MRYWGPRPGDDVKTDVNYKETYFRLLKYARPYLHLIIVVVVLALISSFIGILPDQVMGVAVDNIFQFTTQTETREEVTEPIADGQIRGTFNRDLPITPYIDRVADYIAVNWFPQYTPAVIASLTLVLFFLILFIISRAISVIQGFITVYIGQSLIYDMRNQVYQHLQRLSFKYYADKKTGDLMARTVNDVDSLAQIVVDPVVELVTNLSTLIFVLYFCLIWSWQLTLMALVAVPLLIIITRIFGKLLRVNFRLLRKRIGDLNGFLQDNISGIRVIKAFCRESYEVSRFKEKNRKNYQSRTKLGYLFRLFRPIIDFFNQIGTLVVLLYGSLQVYAGVISPGIFVTFFRYLPRLYNPVTGLSRFYHQIQQALASCERVFEVLDSQPEIKEKEDAFELTSVKGKVEFRDVSFSYDNEVKVIKEINLLAEPGKMIAFVGPSGAGKTTLTNLIPRFYDPDQGDILLDDFNLKDLKINSFRKKIGIVQQEPFLFNDTIMANIAYGKLEASETDIINAAKAANCHQFIEEFPGGYNSVIGERGVKLSGGQKQRLSIARAILADPRILILDEATSSVDTETESLIQNAINNLVKDRTTFVIAHRLSTIQDADQIIVMDEGQIVERGTHEQLIEEEGLYTKLHEMQFRLQGENITQKENNGSSERRGELKNVENEFDNENEEFEF